jgi:hypothetical protein
VGAAEGVRDYRRLTASVGTLMRSENRILIIGGGIGGLTAALALQKAGFEWKIFERAPVLSEIGAGITLWSNAIRALGTLGLADQILKAGEPIELGELRAWHGDVLVVTQWARLAASWALHPSACTVQYCRNCFTTVYRKSGFVLDTLVSMCDRRHKT